MCPKLFQTNLTSTRKATAKDFLVDFPPIIRRLSPERVDAEVLGVLNNRIQAVTSQLLLPLSCKLKRSTPFHLVRSFLSFAFVRKLLYFSELGVHRILNKAEFVALFFLSFHTLWVLRIDYKISPGRTAACSIGVSETILVAFFHVF